MCSSILKQTDTLSRKKRKLVYIIIQNPENIITYLHYSVCNPVLCTKVQGAWPLHQTIKYRRRYGAAVVTTACWKSDGMENEEENEEKTRETKVWGGGSGQDRHATKQPSTGLHARSIGIVQRREPSTHTQHTHTPLVLGATMHTLTQRVLPRCPATAPGWNAAPLADSPDPDQPLATRAPATSRRPRVPGRGRGRHELVAAPMGPTAARTCARIPARPSSARGRSGLPAIARQQ